MTSLDADHEPESAQLIFEALKENRDALDEFEATFSHVSGEEAWLHYSRQTQNDVAALLLAAVFANTGHGRQFGARTAEQHLEYLKRYLKIKCKTDSSPDAIKLKQFAQKEKDQYRAALETKDASVLADFLRGVWQAPTLLLVAGLGLVFLDESRFPEMLHPSASAVGVRLERIYTFLEQDDHPECLIPLELPVIGSSPVNRARAIAETAATATPAPRLLRALQQGFHP